MYCTFPIRIIKCALQTLQEIKNKLELNPTYNTMESKGETTLFTIKSNLLKNCKSVNIK